MPMITLKDDANTYVVEVPEGTRVRLDWLDNDWIGVPDVDNLFQDGEPIWLTPEHILDFCQVAEPADGLRVVSVTPREAAAASQEGEPVPATDGPPAANSPKGDERP